MLRQFINVTKHRRQKVVINNAPENIYIISSPCAFGMQYIKRNIAMLRVLKPALGLV